ncbi:DUF3788 domain-containing protein [Oscillospiraceae bacterium OttesenSCG-928-F05]|nr:DUF3788 domain-containing protein [Oscillospiraceae bacterium OttesenSCG-928-F05]
MIWHRFQRHVETVLPFLHWTVIVGAKEAMEAELLRPTFTEHVQTLLRTAGGLAGARWLMIHVGDEATLGDVKQLIQIRRKIKK